MKFLFGPVNSRRLGQSQGIDLLSQKICNFNCIYCEVGPNIITTCERREYVPTAAILGELEILVTDQEALRAIDVFTITASGEPTLHSGIGKVIRYLKDRTDKPVAVLTNGSLLHEKDVRCDLAAADIVIPSLDSARPESFRKINRPAAGIDLDRLITGLVTFQQEYTGKIWLEVLIAKGINDHDTDIAALQQAIDRIQPDMVQLNTVARPPLETFAQALSRPELEAIAQRLNGPVEIIARTTAVERAKKIRPMTELKILEMLRRRPCTTPEISQALDLSLEEAKAFLEGNCRAGKIFLINHQGEEYYHATE